uniref:Uncharacterized protein n=1 Tax=Rhizophora mucronata TaxID=61149 RepID=A0A2P2QPI0_RHIMU
MVITSNKGKIACLCKSSTKKHQYFIPRAEYRPKNCSQCSATRIYAF